MWQTPGLRPNALPPEVGQAPPRAITLLDRAALNLGERLVVRGGDSWHWTAIALSVGTRVITAYDPPQHVVAPRVPPVACLLTHNQGDQGLDRAAPRPLDDVSGGRHLTG